MERARRSIIEELFIKTGSIDASLPMILSLKVHKSPELSTRSGPRKSFVKEMFPGYELPKNFKAVYQPDGAFLFRKSVSRTKLLVGKGHHKKGEKVLALEKDLMESKSSQTKAVIFLSKPSLQQEHGQASCS